MFQDLTRRDFIKSAAIGFLAVNTFGILPENVFAADNCAVKTRYGTFNGFIDKNGVKTWLGIPFAQPPVRKLRWQAPQLLKPSNNSFDAKKYGNDPMQASMKLGNLVDGFTTTENEDCLTLNIFSRGNGKNKPVMVWIFGGGFVCGHSSEPTYNASNFVSAHDVIIVTLNYRLNIFGFMNLANVDSSFEDSGYLGIKDQIAALTWIKENIAEFGGNPDNITIFGESAGSISCMLLMVTPATKNLFQKVIPQFCTSIYYNTLEISAPVATKYMELGGAKTVNDLMKKSSVEILSLYEKVCEVRSAETLKDYLPTSDGKFMPNNPFMALKTGGARGIKLLTGMAEDEWRYWLVYADNFFELFRKYPKNFSLVLQKYKGTYTSEEIYQRWLKNRPDNEENYAEFTNQLEWRVGHELAAEYQSNFDDAYLYLFSEQSTIENLHSCHAIDLPFTFNNPDSLYENPPQR